jgi:hypothetical protein
MRITSGGNVGIGTTNPGEFVYPPFETPSSITGTATNINATYGNGDLYNIYVSATYTNNYNLNNIVDTNLTTSWGGAPNIYFGNGDFYNGSSYLVTGYNGDWIVYKFPRKTHIYKYVITSTVNKPKRWKLYGSDNGTNWSEISDGSVTGLAAVYTGDNFTKIFNPVTYLYYGFVFNESWRNAASDYAVAMTDLRFYGSGSLYVNGPLTVNGPVFATGLYTDGANIDLINRHILNAANNKTGKTGYSISTGSLIGKSNMILQVAIQAGTDWWSGNEPIAHYIFASSSWKENAISSFNSNTNRLEVWIGYYGTVHFAIDTGLTPSTYVKVLSRT